MYFVFEKNKQFLKQEKKLKNIKDSLGVTSQKRLG